MALPGRFAKPCGLLVVRVRIPCLPLDEQSPRYASVVKRKSLPASNGAFWVRVLVEVITEQTEGPPDWRREPVGSRSSMKSALRVQLPFLPLSNCETEITLRS
jgi:hypothetical protein